MKVTVLIDNIGSGDLKSEWGLSFHIEHNGKIYLLDTGKSDAFIENAWRLGIDLSSVDCAVLSHAHYDHTQGTEVFFAVNDKALVHISSNVADNCYAGWYFLSKYIGIPRGLTAAFPDRFVRHSNICPIGEDVFLVPHSTEGLAKIGRRNHLFVRNGLRFSPDAFAHEQTLVFKTGNGLVLFNSCSHSGPEVIVDEVLRAFPGERICAYLGGLHLFRLTDEEVRKVGEKLRACGIRQIYTGHCTGRRAFDILQEMLGEVIEQFHTGKIIEI